MLFGHSPFRSADQLNRQNNIIRNIKQCKYKFPENIRVSEEAKDLIRRLLVRKPEQRLGHKGGVEIQQHPFFKTINWDDLFYKRLEAPITIKQTTKKRKEVK